MEIVEFSRTAILLSIFSASFLGSIHCLGMCGPIVLVVNRSKVDMVLYHLGRMLMYVALGSLSGYLGQQLLSFFPKSSVALIAPLTLGSIFVAMGTGLLVNKPFHLKLPKVFSKPFNFAIKAKKDQNSNNSIVTLFIGMSSIFLPCGWLYGYVIGAATTDSVIMGAMMMFMFWLGTVPALLAAPWAMNKVIKPIRNKFPKLAALVLIGAGLIVVMTAFTRVDL